MSSSNAKSTKIKIGRIHTRSLPSRIAGWLLLWLSLIVVAVNWVEEFSSLEVLPGGHSVFYFGGGILTAALGLWMAGVMDAKS
jgi:hypothetical protein